MSMLQLKESERGQHGESVGEDYAAGSSSIGISALIAVVVLSAAIGLFYWWVHKPPVASVEVTRIRAHAVHTINTPLDAKGVQTPGEVFDQILILTDLHVRNQSDEPIILREMMTNINVPDGPRSSMAAGPTDYDRIFIGYPELAGLKTRTIQRDTVIQPNQTIDGMIISSFHISKEEWTQRKDLTFTFQFKNHPDVTVTPAVALEEM